MTITRREFVQEGIIAVASASSIVGLLTKSEKDEPQPPEYLGRGRIWLNNHRYHFEVADNLVTLELSQWVRTNPETGVHIHIDHRQLGIAGCRRDEAGSGQHCRFNLDSSQKWRSQRIKALAVLYNLPVKIVRSSHFLYDYQAQQALRKQASAAAVTRAITFVYTCNRFIRIIERMTPPDQIIVETYPELQVSQSGSGF